MNPSRIILAGGSGFLGQALASYFQSLGWEVAILTRSPQANRKAREVRWDAVTLGDWVRELDGADAVVNLTGRTVDCRYTAKNRREIMESRVNSTRVMGEAIGTCARPPRVWLNASSASIYRHTFGPGWDETGSDFTPTPAVHDEFSLTVIHAWEHALNSASTPHTRKLALRTPMVLGHGRNSVFPVLCRLARLGLGGRIGSGRQWVSWIHQEDFCLALEFLIAREDLRGPVNLAVPNPLTNAEMMRAFRELVGAPFGLPATEWMAELGAFFLRTETELMLKSRRVVPRRLEEAGFQFRFPYFSAALADLKQNRNNSTQPRMDKDSRRVAKPEPH